MICAVLLSWAIATVHLSVRWRNEARLQLALDRCAGAEAFALKIRLKEITTMNRALQAARAAALSPVPAIAAAGRATAVGLATPGRVIADLVPHDVDADGLGDLVAVIEVPSIRPLFRLRLHDDRGPMPLMWAKSPPPTLRIRAANPEFTRVSGAVIRKGVIDASDEWKIEWSWLPCHVGQALLEALLWISLFVCGTCALASAWRRSVDHYRQSLRASPLVIAPGRSEGTSLD